MNARAQSVIISGANQGFGFAIAEAFLKAGSHITICARNSNLLDEAYENLLKISCSKQIICAVVADISVSGDFEYVVQEAIKNIGYIDTLVANAGVYGAIGAIEDVDWDEWSKSIDINLKGTVLQCRAVIPHFKSQGKGKIILLSGGGATKPMPFLSSYAAAKAAVVRFGETLAEELRLHHIDVNCIAPGALNTRLLEEILLAGPEKVGMEFYQQSLKQKENGGVPLEIGANLCLFLASSLSDGITGKLISAKWDPWQQLPNHLELLKSSDIYTLRRIVPEDRNMEMEFVEK